MRATAPIIAAVTGSARGSGSMDLVARYAWRLAITALIMAVKKMDSTLSSPNLKFSFIHTILTFLFSTVNDWGYRRFLKNGFLSYPQFL